MLSATKNSRSSYFANLTGFQKRKTKYVDHGSSWLHTWDKYRKLVTFLKELVRYRKMEISLNLIGFTDFFVYSNVSFGLLSFPLIITYLICDPKHILPMLGNFHQFSKLFFMNNNVVGLQTINLMLCILQ